MITQREKQLNFCDRIKETGSKHYGILYLEFCFLKSDIDDFNALFILCFSFVLRVSNSSDLEYRPSNLKHTVLVSRES